MEKPKEFGRRYADLSGVWLRLSDGRRWRGPGRATLSFVLLLVFLPPGWIRADIVIYTLPGTDREIVLEGKTTRVAGGFIDYTHPTFGHLTFSSSTVRVIEYPTKAEQFRKQFDRAKKAEDIDGLLEAARFALQRGLLEEFYKVASEAYKLDRDHATVQRLLQARKNIRVSLGDSEPVIDKIRQLVDRPNMKIETSRHYVLLHDTSSEKVEKKKLTRAQHRLELLEQVFESYMLKFALEGKVLPPPEAPMMVVLFAEERDYLHYVSLLEPSLANALGFWDSQTNLAVFFDQGSTESMRALQGVAQDLQNQKRQVQQSNVDNRTAGRFAQMTNLIETLTKIASVERDIEVVSHEATHQLAGNTGLIPKGKLALAWAHEGLASYFETPDGGGWGGIGSVNPRRLKWYRLLANQTEVANVEFIISDRIFDMAATHEAKVAAYGQAWALTHFLMEHHFEALMRYYEAVSELEVEANSPGIPRSRLSSIFRECFGDVPKLESQWRAYMLQLKPDVERAMDRDQQKKRK